MHRGHVLEAYRVFLGIMEEQRASQARRWRSWSSPASSICRIAPFSTGPTPPATSPIRARATVELGDGVGWDNAHHVLYAGALDIAVGPRWYSTYEMACNCITHYIEQQKISAIPYAGTHRASELALLRNTEPLSAPEADGIP